MSRYAHVHGATDNATPTSEPKFLLPAILKHQGYQPAISGKLHCVRNNLDYRFDNFWSFGREGVVTQSNEGAAAALEKKMERRRKTP